VASHFACIGLPLETAEDLDSFNERALASAERSPRPQAERALWRDASGALVSYHLEDGAVVCATPGFDSGTRLRVQADALAETPDCRYCLALEASVLDDDDEVATRLAFQLLDPERVRDEVHPGEIVVARLSAFAEQIEQWPGEEVYEASLTDEPAYAPESFLPTGLFADLESGSKLRSLFRRRPAVTPGDVMSRGLVTGRVLAAERRVNTLSQVDFAVLRLRSYGGEFEVLADRDELGELPPVGGIVQAHCWLVGDVAA
jgi:hypothetical protein